MKNTTDSNLSQQDTGNSRSEFASTDWLGEMEAALRLMDSAGRKLWEAKEYGIVWPLGEAIQALEKAIATKPRRSPSQ